MDLTLNQVHMRIAKAGLAISALALAAALLTVTCSSSTLTYEIEIETGLAVETPAGDTGIRPDETSSPGASLQPASVARTATTEPETQLRDEDVTSEIDATRINVESTEVASLGSKAWIHLLNLTEKFSPRASGTPQELAAAEFLEQSFRAMGYRSELQAFTVEVLSPDIPVLSISTSSARDIRAFPMSLSGTGRASATLVDADRALEKDVAHLDLNGKVALIERGVISFEEKVARVSEAGAIAAVVYNNERGGFGGQLATRASVPAVAISREDGALIKDLLAARAVTAKVSVVYEIRQTANIIAEKRGSGEGERVVVLGGHMDTVPNVPGANDNGSGIATLLTVAEEIADFSYPFTIRFISFGSEELGLLGSQHYVESLSNEEKTSIIAMLNFDALASGPVTGILGDFNLTRKIIDYAEEHELNVKRRLSLGPTGGSSDHASFRAVGVPVIFFLADDFSRIHTSQDTLEFVQPDLMGTSAALAIGLLDLFARQ